jgi:integrase
MMSVAHELDLISKNPSLKLGRLFSDVEDRREEIAPFTAEEVGIFLDTSASSSPFWFPLDVFLFHSGVRIGEAFGLKWKDLNFKNKLIHIKRTVTNRVEGKTKTKKSNRTIEMSDYLTGVLRDVLEQRRTQFEELPEYVFCASNGSRGDAHNYRFQHFAKVLKEAKLPHHRPHDTRHTYATLLLEAGESIERVSAQLGHSDVKITINTYYHFLPGSKNSKANALPTAGRSTNNVLTLPKVAGQ